MRPFQRNSRGTTAGPVFWNPNNPNHQDVRPGSLGLLEAQDANSKPSSQRLVEVRDAGHMGLGLFAKENIPRGARILAELPLFTMPTETPLLAHSSDDLDDLLLRRHDQDIIDFVDCITLKGFEDPGVLAMETLFCNEAEAQNKNTRLVINKYIFEQLAPTWKLNRDDYFRPLLVDDHASSAAAAPPPEPDFKIGHLHRYADRYVRLWAIWQNNRVKFGAGASKDSGVFRLASRLNHSCCPNAWYDFNPHTGHSRLPAVETLTTHAIRDIAAGEQVLVGYDAVSLKSRGARAEKFAEWDIGGGGCVCALCTEPLVEALQERAATLWRAAEQWVRLGAGTGPRSSAEEEEEVEEGGVAACRDAYEALKMGEEVIALLTHPVWNVREMALAEAYKLCSIICERLATDPEMGLSYDEAVQYWERAMWFSGEKCQVYMILVGTDGREMKMADERFRELGNRRERWTALQNGWQWPPRP